MGSELSAMDRRSIERRESAVSRPEALSTGFHSRGGDALSGANVAVDPSIIAFDYLMDRYIGRFLTAAEKIGGHVLQVSKFVQEAFAVQKELLIKIKQTQKPDFAGLEEFLEPLIEVIVKAGNARTDGRRFGYNDHLMAAAESLFALKWIAYTGKDCDMRMPIAHVEENGGMTEGFCNMVLVEYNKDAKHVEWAKALKELYLPGLRDYVKTFYPLGPVWGSESSQASPSKPKEGISAAFQQINTWNVTAGLIKVTDDVKAKNRADRTGIVGASEKDTRVRSQAFSIAGPPKLELQMGRKWVVESQIGQKGLVIDDCDSKQSVYVYGCKDSVLQIQGKVNNITVDNCAKMEVVFKDVVAAFEIVNSNGVEAQCQGSAPTISVDNTSSCQLYLSKDSLHASISTAKSSEINVLVPSADTNGDWVEHLLPQQYIHTFKDGRFETNAASHSGG